MLSRVVAGARISLALGLLSAIVAAAVGSGVGAASGFGGGWLDALLMRTTDAMLSMPRLPVLMVVAAIVRPSVAGLVLLVGLVGWMEVARLVRAEVRSLRSRDFVAAARAAGASGWRIVVRHLLPLVAPTIVVAATIAVGRNILLESALSFFGVGVQPPSASWGSMLYQAQTSLSTEPWLAIFPGTMIFLAVLLANRLGERIAADSVESSRYVVLGSSVASRAKAGSG